MENGAPVLVYVEHEAGAVQHRLDARPRHLLAVSDGVKLEGGAFHRDADAQDCGEGAARVGVAAANQCARRSPRFALRSVTQRGDRPPTTNGTISRRGPIGPFVLDPTLGG